MNNKIENLKEKLKQALSSTARVISDDLSKKTKLGNQKKADKLEFFELENLNLNVHSCESFVICT